MTHRASFAVEKQAGSRLDPAVNPLYEAAPDHLLIMTTKKGGLAARESRNAYK